MLNDNNRPAPTMRVDKMRASMDPLDPYPRLDIYVQRSSSRHREVLMNMQTPPDIKPPTPQRHGAKWGFGL